MNIAYVSALDVHRRGGTEKCGAWLIEDLAREHHVTVFANQVEDVAGPGLRVARVPVIRRPLLLRFISFVAVSACMLVARRVSGRDRLDIVHATGPDCPIADVITAHFCQARWLELRRSGVVAAPKRTWAQTIKDHLLYQPYSNLAATLERRIFTGGRVKRIIAVSEGLRRDLIQYYAVPPDRIVVIPNAVDDRVFLTESEKAAHRAAIREQYGLAPDDLVLLFVAAGDWLRKGLPMAIEALSLLPDPKVKLLVVGGDTIPVFCAMAEGLRLGSRVVFAGLVPDVQCYYAASDVFVFPTLYETFSLVAWEAAGAGLPIVAATTGGVEDLVEDGISGLLVRPDAQDIAAKISWLIQDGALRARLGAEACRRAKGVSRSEVTRRTLAVYRDVLGRAGERDAEAPPANASGGIRP